MRHLHVHAQESPRCILTPFAVALSMRLAGRGGGMFSCGACFLKNEAQTLRFAQSMGLALPAEHRSGFAPADRHRAEDRKPWAGDAGATREPLPPCATGPGRPAAEPARRRCRRAGAQKPAKPPAPGGPNHGTAREGAAPAGPGKGPSAQHGAASSSRFQPGRPRQQPAPSEREESASSES